MYEIKNDKRFKAYHGDMPSDLLDRMQIVLASYGLEIVKKESGDFYTEYEIEVIK
jgi:hypothetical protein